MNKFYDKLNAINFKAISYKYCDSKIQIEPCDLKEYCGAITENTYNDLLTFGVNSFDKSDNEKIKIYCQDIIDKNLETCKQIELRYFNQIQNVCNELKIIRNFNDYILAIVLSHSHVALKYQDCVLQNLINYFIKFKTTNFHRSKSISVQSYPDNNFILLTLTFVNNNLNFNQVYLQNVDPRKIQAILMEP